MGGGGVLLLLLCRLEENFHISDMLRVKGQLTRPGETLSLKRGAGLTDVCEALSDQKVVSLVSSCLSAAEG